MNFSNIFVILCKLVAFLLLYTPGGSMADDFDRKVSLRVRNLAGFPIMVNWRANDGRLVPQSSSFIRNGTKFKISSFPTHSFVFTCYDAIDKKSYYRETCNRQAKVPPLVTMGKDEMKVIVTYNYEEGLVLESSTASSRQTATIQQAIKECRFKKQMPTQIQTLNSEYKLPDAGCVESFMEEFLKRKWNEKKTMRKYRDSLSDRMTMYMCQEANETKVDEVMDINNNENGKIVTKMLLNTPTAKIWTVDNFASDDECDDIIEHVQDDLEEAVEYIDDEDKGHRQASAKSIFLNNFPYDDHELLQNYPPAKLYKKVHETTRKVTGLNVSIEGQEGISVIRYHPGQQYLPHCDGPCNQDDGPEIKLGSRIATSILYCRVATKGGQTVFPNAGITVSQKRGRLLLFSYDAEKKDVTHLLYRMADPNGLTLHAGCPVLEGEKWISTFWWRYGVSNKEGEGWSSFDALGNSLETQP
jgi:prolyl 4-hydroxylase